MSQPLGITVISHPGTPDTTGLWDVVYPQGRVDGFTDVSLVKEFLSHVLGRTVYKLYRDTTLPNGDTHWWVSERLSFMETKPQAQKRRPVHGIVQANTSGLIR